LKLPKRKRTTRAKRWIIDKHGEMSTNPNDMIDGGALLPLGSERELGGHKGYALSGDGGYSHVGIEWCNWGPFAPPLPCARKSLLVV